MKLLRTTDRALLTALVVVAGSSCASESPVEFARVAQAEGRKVVHTGSLTVSVADLGAARAKVESIVANVGGSLDRSTDRTDESVSILARVPAAQLHETMDQIAGLGRVDERSTTSADVTRQHQDLDIRLTNARALRKRLRELLDRAEDVEDVLAIEKELVRVQSEIESMESQLKDLNSRIEFSRLSIELRRKRTLGPLGLLGYGLWWAVEKLFVLN